MRVALRGARSLLSMALASAASAAALCGCSSQPDPNVLTVTRQACAPEWQPRHSGLLTVEVSNRLPTVVDVELLATGTQRVYAEIPTLGPGTTRPLSVTLDPGRYTWQCADITNTIDTSNPEPVTGAKVSDPTPSYIPVGPDDLDAAVDAYRVSVTGGIVTLVADTDRLQALVDGGRLAAAKAQWLVAHLDYERLGAAYDTFGPFDDEINGRADGLPEGVDDPHFTGFLRLEYGLWHDQPQPVLAAVANRLDGFVHGLQAAFPHQLMLNTDLPLRAHEILENALQFELTGDTDEGSHTNLATIRANVEGTQTTLNALQPLLEKREPQLLSSIETQLGQLTTLLDTLDTPSGWTPVESLPEASREQLDASMDGVLAQLSIIPGSLRLFAVGAD